jgi:hypothetical protein
MHTHYHIDPNGIQIYPSENTHTQYHTQWNHNAYYSEWRLIIVLLLRYSKYKHGAVLMAYIWHFYVANKDVFTRSTTSNSLHEWRVYLCQIRISPHQHATQYHTQWNHNAYYSEWRHNAKGIIIENITQRFVSLRLMDISVITTRGQVFHSHIRMLIVIKFEKSLYCFEILTQRFVSFDFALILFQASISNTNLRA